jgi:propionate catabolism operon transcriptional regulator
LVTIIKGQFITVEDVTSILSQADFKPKAHYDTPSIDLSKTLDEISVEVINLVLAEEKNNQSRAAKRLGISRSTLWKKLNS